ncbi:uncharacterized protein C1orf159 homolog [Vidua macroura]|uniref:uncharacterized protein C1orf159 homolog n=1 Tax=Vidua macroura TaxID=187451 RepID=UPI0023A7F5A2|nr:uncharacterized protein C1orf159 homolog [Vidua macroura]XP_053853803.1 uncharacterized protein C1orf159 homolog [Vidua macroura]XP_053853804.1 uncharacterized protein C1orf159 homolog [Vidua macroura]XP_053853805.1 uncharacterized protein C1orf159 homolog [Vidua macroura]
MEVPSVLLLTRLVAEAAGKSTENSAPAPPCCEGMLDPNGSCALGPRCGTGGPEAAAALILGSFLLCLFLILSVAAFFHLRRGSRLPGLLHGRSKASVLQPSETASMIPPAASSVRKPRYVRRERSLGPPDSRVSNV